MKFSFKKKFTEIRIQIIWKILDFCYQNFQLLRIGYQNSQFYRLLILVSFLVCFVWNCSPIPAKKIDLAGDWEYSWGRDISNLNISHKDINWKTVRLPGDVPNREGDSQLVVRRFLPKKSLDVRDPAIYIYIVLENYDMYLDGIKIHSFGSVDNLSQQISSFVNPHVIPLPDNYEGKELRMHFHSTYRQFIGLDHYIFIANQGDIKEAMLLYDYPRYILGAIYLLIGLGSFLLYWFFPNNRIFLSYSMLVLLNSGITLLGNYLSLYFFDNKKLSIFIYNLIIYFLPLTFFWFLGEVYKEKYSKAFLVSKIIYFVVALVFLLIEIAGLSSFINAESYFEIIVIPGFAFILYVIGRESSRGHYDSKILFCGMLVVLLFSLHDILRDFGILHSTIVMYWYGIFLFLLSQGTIIFRRLYSIQKNLDLKENELLVAKKIQNSLLPTLPVKIGNWELESFYGPMKVVGGDLYDLLLDDDGNFGVIILDVSGHGVGASIIASMAKVTFSNSISLIQNPGELMREMNQSLSGKIGDNFVTAFYICGNTHQSTVRYSSAGHPPSFHVNNSNYTVTEFRTKSKPIGISKDYLFDTGNLTLSDGDILLLYTDGIIELQSPKGEEFGDKRVKDILLQLSHLDLHSIKKSLIREFQSWSGSTHFSNVDDLSFVLLRWKKRI